MKRLLSLRRAAVSRKSTHVNKCCTLRATVSNVAKFRLIHSFGGKLNSSNINDGEGSSSDGGSSNRANFQFLFLGGSTAFGIGVSLMLWSQERKRNAEVLLLNGCCLVHKLLIVIVG